MLVSSALCNESLRILSFAFLWRYAQYQVKCSCVVSQSWLITFVFIIVAETHGGLVQRVSSETRFSLVYI